MDMMNNNYLYVIFLSIFALVGGCGSESTNTTGKERDFNKKTLLFVDKSKSAIENSQLDEYSQRLETIVRSCMNQNGDRFSICFVHANTGGVNYQLDKKFYIENLVLSGGGLDQVNQRDEYEGKIQKIKGECWDSVKRSLEQMNMNKTGLETDLWSTLEVISRNFSESKPGDEKTVIFISDMVESKKGLGRRDFHKQPIKSKMEAESFAKADADWISNNMKVSKEHLQGIQVKIWTPSDAMDNNHFQNLRYYWEALFGEFGIENIIYN